MEPQTQMITFFPVAAALSSCAESRPQRPTEAAGDSHSQSLFVIVNS